MVWLYSTVSVRNNYEYVYPDDISVLQDISVYSVRSFGWPLSLRIFPASTTYVRSRPKQSTVKKIHLGILYRITLDQYEEESRE